MECTTLSSLRQRYTSPDPVARKAVVIAARECSDPDTLGFLLSALHDADKAVRNEAVQALASFGSPAVGPLSECLQDRDWRIRYRAAEGLGMIGDPTPAGLLSTLTRDEKDHVRYMAAMALASISPLSAASFLLPLLDDENPYVRRAAASGLGRCGRPEIITLLAEAREREEDTEVRSTIDLSISSLLKI